MADDKKNNVATGAELEAVALEIYGKLVSAGVPRNGEQLATAAFVKANEFLAVKAKIKSGEISLEPKEESKWSDVCAPNLPKFHPHNLVSRAMGDPELVKKIHEWLEKNPTPERNPEELVDRLNRTFRSLDWSDTEVKTARAIFPEYFKSAAA